MKRFIANLMAGLCIVAGLTVTTNVFAQDPGAQASGYMSDILGMAYDETDLAHKSLVRLYGGFVFEPFGGAPENQPPTALAVILGYTNIVAMILGAVIMSYVILAGAMNTAASGEMLGRSWSSVWLPLRTATAFGLIMPSAQGETFSVAQALVVWMIIVGSNSATWLWEKGTNALATGSPVMATTVMIDSNTFLKYGKLMHCAAVRDGMLKLRDGSSPGVRIDIHKNATPGTSGTETITTSHLSGLAGVVGNLEHATRLTFEGCGTINFPTGQAILEDSSNQTLGGQTVITKFHGQIQKQFDTAVHSNIGPVLTTALSFSNGLLSKNINAKAYDAAISTGGPEEAAMKELIATSAAELKEVQNAFEAYVEKVRVDSVPPDVGAAWKETMLAGGWMRAGVWFFEASRIQGFVQTMLAGLDGMAEPNNSAVFVPCSMTTHGFTSCKDQNEEYFSKLSAFDPVSKYLTQNSIRKTPPVGGNGVSVTDLTSPVDDDVSEFKKDWGRSLSVSISQGVMRGLMWGGQFSLASSVGGNAEQVTAETTSGMVSPFTAVTSIGRGLQNISIVVWTSGLAVSGMMGWTDSVWGKLADFGSGGVGSILKGVSQYTLATLAPVMAGIATLAFMLAYALPFMPIAVWIMLVCGYLLLTIEAIAAAPLAVIMLATPEGEGMAGGNFQKALNMINAIILRPTLSIVGLFAAMTLSYVGFSLLNDLFWGVATLATGSSLFEVMALMFIYVTLAYKVCEYMVSIIHKIPDQIMEWMGGGMGRDFGENAASQGITGSLTQNAASGGLSVGAGVATAGKLRKQRDTQIAEKEKADTKKGWSDA